MKTNTSEIAGRVEPWVIRRARPTDAAALLAYFEQIAAEAPNNTSIRRQHMPLNIASTRDQIARYGADARSVLLVAVHRRAVIGFVSLTGSDSPFTAHQVELSINVRADWRGCGLGSGLLRMALSWARAQPHIERVQLEALTRNAAAVRLYQRHGFVIEGVRRAAYRLVDEPEIDHALDATEMAKIIRRNVDGTSRVTQVAGRWQEG